MLRKYGIVRPSVLAIIAVFSLMACSTMDLKDYPEATEEIFADAHMINGVSVVVQPLLDEEESLRYFGVDLTDKNILAIHVAIRNADKNNSYLVFSDALQISPKDAIDITHGPERGSQLAADITRTTAHALTPLIIADIFLQNDFLGLTGAFVLPLLAVSIQQQSDASVIEERFEVNKFHTGTLNPGETMGGFTYFDLGALESIDTPRLCINILNSIDGYEFPYCVDIPVER